MDLTSLIITLLLAALLLVLLIRLPWAILSNLKAGHRFRQGLADGLEQLRLSRMLKYLGIDRGAYLHKQSALDIKQQMQRCDTCDAKSRCDETLDSEQSPQTDSLGFCANIEDLKKVRSTDR